MSTATKKKPAAKPVEETTDAPGTTPMNADQRAVLQRQLEHAQAALAGAGPAPPIEEPRDRNVGDRLDLIEAAIGTGLNLDLNQFDPQAVVSARADVIRKFSEALAAGAVQAAEDIGKDLTDKQRIERIEAILNSRGSLI